MKGKNKKTYNYLLHKISTLVLLSSKSIIKLTNISIRQTFGRSLSLNLEDSI